MPQPKPEGFLVVIPARGGSKRLPRKNLMKIGQDSLLGRAIRCVDTLDKVSEICVTTDDKEIADEALRYGPYVHFLRPEFLATDNARTIDVVIHAVEWFEAKGRCFKGVILLQPTSPFRAKQHVQGAIELFEVRGANGVVSVTEMEHPIQWCAQLSDDSSMEAFGESQGTQQRSQDLKPYHRLNGAIYIFKTGAELREKGIVYDKNTIAYQMDSVSSVDIDTEADFLLARAMWQLGQEKKQ